MLQLVADYSQFSDLEHLFIHPFRLRFRGRGWRRREPSTLINSQYIFSSIVMEPGVQDQQYTDRWGKHQYSRAGKGVFLYQPVFELADLALLFLGASIQRG